jgi:hypothetical protein
MVFDSVDDGLKVLQSSGDVFQKELVLDGEAVQKQAVDGKGSQHPVLGGVVFECLWVADEVLVLVVALDADAEHVFDGLTQAVESGARQRLAIVQIISDPQLSYAFESDSVGSLYGAHQPCVLLESVCVSHGGSDFLGKNMKKRM